MRSFTRTALLASAAFAMQAIAVQAAEDRPKGDFRQCLEVSPECPVNATLYGYTPNMGANAFLCALFGVCFISTIVMGIMTKTWTYTAALGVGTFLETAGYVGRVIMNGNPWSESGFKLQICCLVLGPSFVAAAIYLTLKHFVLYCGPEHSLLKARLYPWIFIGCDFGSIVLQAVGGGMAAAGGTKNAKLIDAGNNLIVAGIAFQVVTMAVCGLLVIVYIFRYRKARSTQASLNEKSSYQMDKEQGGISLGKIKLFGAMIVLAYTTILIRCIYRLPEMAGGWGNALMRNEREFLLLDGMMLAIACLVLTVFHPAYWFPPFAAFRRSK
ncbi:RTA1-domain-containing protein [Plenodomus tracheiphilus IPT5]|uniref:RTA1-domain-containing protein n=1 Tax=Plenodomus tracheiphilus IPT5 TaxID=1408161 RepID=A0A6A7AYC2_9PLEO|nr:RTA1-domain-containing protein [Plenodomus tracheiphilus IPT5]